MVNNQVHLFPLIRHISKKVTPLLLKTPISGNGVSVLSLISGLATGWLLMVGSFNATPVAAIFLVVSYILDNCDGEVARARGEDSKFGEALDDFVDWVVHAIFFFALGTSYSEATADDLWFWLGSAATVGASINYFIGQYLTFFSHRGERDEINVDVEKENVLPSTPLLWGIYIIRELSRADFCFLVLLLASIDCLWILLPTGAFGAQLYWMTQFVHGARQFHV